MRNPLVVVPRFDGLVGGAASVCGAGIPGRAVRESAVARPIDSPHSPAADRDLQRSFVQQKIFTLPQIVTLDGSRPERSGRGAHVKYRPYAFTEQGVAMLSSVLRSRRAVRVNVEIMRAFVRLRAMLASNEDLARKLAALEKRYDAQFKAVFDAIRQLMAPPEPKLRRSIGFVSNN